MRIKTSLLLDTHRRIRNAAPLVSVVTARSRRDARSFASKWAASVGARLAVAPRPTMDAATALIEVYGARELVVLFFGDDLKATFEVARSFLEQFPKIEVAVVARMADVVGVLGDSSVGHETLTSLVLGLAPVEPLDEELLNQVIKSDRLKPFLRSPYEGLLYFLLEAHRETQGRFQANRRVAGASRKTYEVDLINTDVGLIVEIDGTQHRTEEHIHRDEEKQRDLEAVGFEIRRYETETLVRDPNAVWADLHNQLNNLMNYRRVTS